MRGVLTSGWHSRSVTTQTCSFARQALRVRTHREAPVDVRHLGVQVEAEDEEENTRHHAGAAADKLKEVDASARRAHHDGLYADESDEGQHLEGREMVGWRQRWCGCWWVSKQNVMSREKILTIRVLVWTCAFAFSEIAGL